MCRVTVSGKVSENLQVAPEIKIQTNAPSASNSGSGSIIPAAVAVAVNTNTDSSTIVTNGK